MARLAPIASSAAIFGALLLLGFAASQRVVAGAATAEQVTLRLWPAGQGMINVSQVGRTSVSCDFRAVLLLTPPAACDVPVTIGNPVTLTAIALPQAEAEIPEALRNLLPDFPAPNPAFVRWSRAGCEGTGPCTFTPETDGDWVTALFTPLQLEVGVNDGTVAVQGDGGPLKCVGDPRATDPPKPSLGGFGQKTCHGLIPADAEVALVATPEFLGDLSRWRADCVEGVDPISSTCTVAMTNTVTFASVAFGKPPPAAPNFPFQIKARVRVKRGGSGQGMVTGSGFECGAQCALDFDYQTRVTIKADAAQGSTFVRWDGVCATGSTCKFNAGSATLVQARFDASTPTTTPTSTTTTTTTTTTSTTTTTTKRTRTTPTKPPVRLTVRFARVSVKGRGIGRTLVVVVHVNRAARLQARLLQRRKAMILSRNVALVQGRNSVRLPVPRRAKHGTYRLSLRVASGGSVRTVTKPVKIPR